jgi:hypothetical protein
VETFLEFASPAVILSERPPGLETRRIAPDDPFHEADFDVEVALFPARQFSSCGGLVQHTQIHIFVSQASSTHLRRCPRTLCPTVSTIWPFRHFVLGISIGGRLAYL